MISADILDIAVLICSYSDGEMPSDDLDEEGLYFPASVPKPYMRPFLVDSSNYVQEDEVV